MSDEVLDTGRWVQPTAEMAGLPDDGNGNGNGEPAPPADNTEVMAKLDEIQGQLTVIINKENKIIETQQLHTQMLQQIIDKPVGTNGKFPIFFPQYLGSLFGYKVVLNPNPPKNP